MATEYGFHAVDYVIFGGMVMLSIAIGIYHACVGGRQTSTNEYFLGNRRLNISPVAISLLVSFHSSIYVLGFPAEMYTYGLMPIWYKVGAIVAGIIGAQITVPLFYPLKLTSAFEYFELRYKSKAARKFATVVGIVNNIVYVGIVLYGPAIALEAVTDFPFWASVLSAITAAMLYTTIGGLKAVVWTDVVQCIIMIIGMLAIIIKGMVDVGSVADVARINMENLRLNFFEFDPDPTVRQSFWYLFFGGMVGYSILIFNQSTVQRISSLKTEKEARNMMFSMGPAFLIMGILICIESMVMFAYFNVVGCDPLKAGYIKSPNQLVPYMVVRSFKNIPGLAGIYLASLYSASLSTISSALNSVSAQTIHDFIKPRFKDLSEGKVTLMAKISVLFYGCLSLGFTIVVANIPGSLVQITISMMSSISGPLTGIYLYSVLCPWATKKGFLIGGSISFLLVFWLSLGQNFISQRPRQPWLPLNPINSCPLNLTTISNLTLEGYEETNLRLEAYEEEMAIYNNIKPTGIDRLFSISFRWFGTVGVLLSVVAGSIVSFLTGHPSVEDVDVRYILPLGDHLFPYLPERVRNYLKFGVNFSKRKSWLENLQQKSSSTKEDENSAGEFETCPLQEI